jgi:cytochrome c oxidase assembly protein Cox11
MSTTSRDFELARQRRAVRRTVGICVAVVVIMLGLFLAQHV